MTPSEIQNAGNWDQTTSGPGKCHDLDDSGDSDAYDHCDGDHGEPASAEALHPFPLSQVLETLASLPQMSA